MMKKRREPVKLIDKESEIITYFNNTITEYENSENYLDISDTNSYEKVLSFNEEEANSIMKNLIKNNKKLFSDSLNHIPMYFSENMKKIKNPVSVNQNKKNLKENINYDDFIKLVPYFIQKHFLNSKIKKDIASKENKEEKSNKDQSKENILNINTSNSVNKETINRLYEPILEDITISLFLSLKLKDYNKNELDLTQSFITSENLLYLLFTFYTNTNINKLILAINKIGPESMFQLSRIFLYNNRILELDLSSNGLNDNSLALLTTFQTNNTNIKDSTNNSNPKFFKDFPFTKFSLASNMLTSKSGKTIASIILNAPLLNYLNIFKNQIGEGFIHIANSIQTLQQKRKSELIVLIASSIKIDSYSLYQLGNVVKSNFCTIESLILSDNVLNNKGGKYLIDSLMLNKSIQELIMVKCNLSDQYGIEKALNELVFKNTTIRKLDLFGNSLSNSDLMTRNLLSFRNQKNSIGVVISENDMDRDSPRDNQIDNMIMKEINEVLKDLNKDVNIDFDEDISYTFHQMQSYDQANNKIIYKINNVLTDAISKDLDLKVLDIHKNNCINKNDQEEAKFKESVKENEDHLKVLY